MDVVFASKHDMIALIANPTDISPPGPWQPATWADYERSRDAMTEGSGRLFFDEGYLWVAMGGEGINHSRLNDLVTLVIFLWFSQKLPQQTFDSMSGCLLEKVGCQGASPDKVLYIGDDAPRWRENESRSIDLKKWRVPDLVAEIADTTLVSDLDEKKQLYMKLGIPEYWVVDVQGARAFAFRLNEMGRYQEIDVSTALPGLAIEHLTQTLKQLSQGMSNSEAAQHFSQRLQSSS
jgi:Uma2 family endonuclease